MSKKPKKPQPINEPVRPDPPKDEEKDSEPPRPTMNEILGRIEKEDKEER